MDEPEEQIRNILTSIEGIQFRISRRTVILNPAAGHRTDGGATCKTGLTVLLGSKLMVILGTPLPICCMQVLCGASPGKLGPDGGGGVWPWYGVNRLEMHRDAIKPGDRVLVVDDLLPQGSARAARARGECGRYCRRHVVSDRTGFLAWPR